MRLILALALWPSLAYAGDAIVTNVPEQVDQKFYLELSAEDLRTITTALGEIPKRIADQMILKINGQLALQGKMRDAYVDAVSQRDTLTKEDVKAKRR